MDEKREEGGKDKNGSEFETNKHEKENDAEVSGLEEIIKEDPGVDSQDIASEESEEISQGKNAVNVREFVEKVEISHDSSPLLKRINFLESWNATDFNRESPVADASTSIKYEFISDKNSFYESEKKQLKENFEFIVKKPERKDSAIDRSLILPADADNNSMNFVINPELEEVKNFGMPSIEYFSYKYENRPADDLKLPFERFDTKYKEMR